jgi:hypothetical protein
MATQSPRVELRGLCPRELAEALDAIAMARGLDRNAFVVQVLESEVKRVLHESSVIHRALHGNPLLAEPNWNVARESMPLYVAEPMAVTLH